VVVAGDISDIIAYTCRLVAIGTDVTVRSVGCDMHSRCCRGGAASRRGDAPRRRAGKSARSRLGMQIPGKAVGSTRNLAN
jgi:hypothetical protein